MEFVSAFNIALFSLAFCIFITTAAFGLALKLKFFSLIDIVWSYLFTAVTLIYVFIPGGWLPRKAVLVAIVTFWSVRLGTHLLTRLKNHFPIEDARYTDLRAKWAKTLNFNFLVFYLFQGLSVVILAVPFMLIALNPDESFSTLEIVGLLVYLTAVTGESLADAQLRRFRNDPANKGKVCEVGLWKYSRHPNYFFEWVIWVGYFLIAFAAPNGGLALSSPVLMLLLLVKVTGVPYAEASSLKSRGDAYRDYQRRVNRFVPWWPRSG